MTGLVVLAGLAMFGLLILFYLLQVGRLASVNDDIAAQEANNATLNSEIASLSKYEDLQAEAQQQQQLLNDAYAGEVSYSGLMIGTCARVVPSDAFLSALSVTTPGATTTGDDAHNHHDRGLHRIDDGQRRGDRVRLAQPVADEPRRVTDRENPWMPTITSNT